MQHSRTKLVSYILFGIALLITANAQFHYGADYFIDDAFITFRHVQNFVNGHGITYNIGELVEGTSNLLYVFALSALSMFWDIQVSALWIGYISGLAVIVVLFFLSRAIRQKDSLINSIAITLVAVNASYIYWSVKGLETQINTFLLCSIIFSFYQSHISGKEKYYIYYFILLSIFVISRPENFIFSLSSLAFSLLYHKNDLRRFVCNHLIGILLPLLSILSLVIWRMSYYGYPLPNTVYAKSFYTVLLFKYKINIFKEIMSGLNTLTGDYILGFVESISSITVLSLVASLFYKRIFTFKMYLLMIIGFYLTLTIYARWDWMPHYRLLEPTIPVIMILFQEFIYDVTNN